MPLQLFAARHPEIDYFWNWEMDVRYTGHYYDLFSSLTDWARTQPRSGLWERNKRFYIPSVHGTYNDLMESVMESRDEDRQAPLDTRNIGVTPALSHDQTDEEADLITLFPMFDTNGTLWPHKDHLINYNDQATRPNVRYGTVGTNMRFSRRLLDNMAEENLRGHGMMSEMWPPTLAAQNDMKAVFVPHPVFLDRQWTGKDLQDTFNAGPDGQVGGSLDTVINQELNFDGSTWFWNSRFGLNLYRRWLGAVSEGPGSSMASLPPAYACWVP